jgi:ribosome-associated heat shock protein Hsp15
MTATSVTQFETNDSTLRIDKWLWHCRFFKSRSHAARFVASGKVRVNRRTISKTAHPLKEGDVLTFVHQDEVQVVLVRALGVRRGPPAEAKCLYQDLSCAQDTLDHERPLAPASRPMIDPAYGQPDFIPVRAAHG